MRTIKRTRLLALVACIIVFTIGFGVSTKVSSNLLTPGGETNLLSLASNTAQGECDGWCYSGTCWFSQSGCCGFSGYIGCGVYCPC